MDSYVRIPQWPTSCTKCDRVFKDCANINALWNDSAPSSDIMPSTMTGFSEAVTGCASSLRSYFNASWGGSIDNTFHFECESEVATVALVGMEEIENLQYATTYGEWRTYSINQTITITKNHSLWMRSSVARNSLYNNHFSITGKVGAKGDIRYLLNPEATSAEMDSDCFNGLFLGCVGLTSAPLLLATDLGYSNRCYASMFSGCTGLTEIPSLPAQWLCISCYEGMFFGCTGLTSVSLSSATRLNMGCYSNMFRGCSNLSAITVAFTEWNDEESATFNWLEGVASVGTFTCPAGLNDSMRDESHIPVGWTVRHP